MNLKNLPLPEDVHAKLVKLAEEDHRTLRATVTVLVEQELKRRATPPASPEAIPHVQR